MTNFTEDTTGFDFPPSKSVVCPAQFLFPYWAIPDPDSLRWRGSLQNLLSQITPGCKEQGTFLQRSKFLANTMLEMIIFFFFIWCKLDGLL